MARVITCVPAGNRARHTSRMPDVTIVLAAVKSALAAAYPTVPVKTSKRTAAGGRPQQGGWAPGYPAPCFVLSSATAEAIDKVPSFEHVSVGYRIVVEYVKPAQAAVADAVDTGPAPVVEDEDVREKREAIRDALYKTLAAVPGFFDTRTESLLPYDQTGDGNAALLVSGEAFTFTTTIPRP